MSKKSFQRITGPTAPFNLNSVDATGHSDGDVAMFLNDTAYAMTIPHEHAGSTAANRIKTPGGTSVVIAAGAIATLIRNSAASRWQLDASVGTGTSGQYRSLTYTSDGTTLTFLVDGDGNAVYTLEDLE